MVNTKDLNLNSNIQIPLLTKMLKKHIKIILLNHLFILETILKNATMIFVPVISKNNIKVISKEYFHCSKCKRWL